MTKKKSTKTRTTISIDTEILRKSQAKAAADGRTFSNYVEQLLIAALTKA